MLARPVLEELDGIALLSFTTTPANPIQLVAKRGIDFAFSLAFVLVTLPIQALAALLDPDHVARPGFLPTGPLRLERPAFHAAEVPHDVRRSRGRLHEVSHLNEMSGPVFKVSKDPRLTPVGRLLRRLSIDELPQLWNVILGNMSLVGPRPPLPEEVARYEPWQRRRLSMKPGITCLWQVSGRATWTSTVGWPST